MLTIHACTRNVFQEVIFCFLNVSYCHTSTISGTPCYTHTLFKPQTATKTDKSIVPSVMCGKLRIHNCPFRGVDSMLFMYLGAFSMKKTRSFISDGS